MTLPPNACVIVLQTGGIRQDWTGVLQEVLYCRQPDTAGDNDTQLYPACAALGRGRLNEPNGVPWTSKSTSKSGPAGRKSKLTYIRC